MMDSLRILTLALSLAGALSACEAKDPSSSPEGGGAAGRPAGGEGGVEPAPVLMERCEPLSEDYPSDAWGACISDNGRYELAGESTPSSAARTAAYEQIAELLWRQQRPSPEDFIQAELIYAEAEGLQSRVARRYDSHLDKPEGADCSLEDAGERWPAYCVGPAQIDPLIGEAFLQGVMGQAPAQNAKRVQAGLLWFSYVSAYKEANSCAAKAKDCDSHWAYTNGGTQRDEEPLGFGGWAQRANPSSYEQLFDAHLAVRCWRDLDGGELAEDMELMSQALAQLDRALDFALTQGLLVELMALSEAQGERAEALRAGLAALGPVLGRSLEARGLLNEGRAAWEGRWASLADEDIAALITLLSDSACAP